MVRFVEGRPNPRFTRQRLGVALDAIGCGDIDVRLRAVRTDAEAAEPVFTGSPTILINGADPFAHSHSVVGLSCRLYANPAGISGSPSVEQLITALASVDPE